MYRNMCLDMRDHIRGRAAVMLAFGDELMPLVVWEVISLYLSISHTQLQVTSPTARKAVPGMIDWEGG